MTQHLMLLKCIYLVITTTTYRLMYSNNDNNNNVYVGDLADFFS